jgi:hypothetical protein
MVHLPSKGLKRETLPCGFIPEEVELDRCLIVKTKHGLVWSRCIHKHLR